MVKGGEMASIYEKRPWLKNYPEWVPHDLEIGKNTAIADFMLSAEQKPDSPAVHYFDHTISYGEIDRLSNRFAAALEDLGVVKGDRVILVLQNIPQFLISTYAAWKIGAIVVPLNPMYKESELSYFYENSNAKIFIILEEIADQLDISFLDNTSIEKVITTSPLDFYPDQTNLPKLLGNTQKKPVPGCLDMLEETKNAIRNGWLYTGDVGKMDDDGWFYVVDRKKDLIIASGYKVWPRDVEDVIYQHPAVKETAVVGVPDSYRGGTVKAYVALKKGEENLIGPEDIISFCKERLAAYKYPREVEIVSEIPKTLTGKILRRTLRKEKK